MRRAVRGGVQGAGRPRWRVALLAAAGAAIGVAGGAAHAQQTTQNPWVTLAWDAPAGCPSAAEVSASVDQLLGDRTPRPATPLQVSARIKKEGASTFRARLELVAPDGKRVREFKGASCKAVADAAALIIGLTIDPSALVMSPPAPPPPATPPPSTPPPAPTYVPYDGPPPPPPLPFEGPADDFDPQEPMSSPIPDLSKRNNQPQPAPPQPLPDLPFTEPQTAPRRPTPPPAPRPRVQPRPAPPLPTPLVCVPPPPKPKRFSPHDRGPHRSRPPAGAISAASPAPEASPEPASVSFRFSAWGGGDAGSLPQIAAGLGASAWLLVGRQRFELGASVWPQRIARLPAEPAVGVTVSLVTGAAGICRDLLRVGIFEAGPCLGFELGRMTADGFGVPLPSLNEVLWTALKPGLMATLGPRGSATFVLRFDAVLPLDRPEFVIAGAGVVHRPAVVAGRASVGLELSF